MSVNRADSQIISNFAVNFFLDFIRELIVVKSTTKNCIFLQLPQKTLADNKLGSMKEQSFLSLGAIMQIK